MQDFIVVHTHMGLCIAFMIHKHYCNAKDINAYKPNIRAMHEPIKSACEIL